MSELAAARNSMAAAAGDAVRRTQKRYGRLPGVTLTPDLIAARHCVDVLVTGVKEDPNDPRRLVWLAEAVQRTRRDLRRWARMRAVADPSALVVRTALRRIALIGQGGGEDEAETRLLKRAFSLAHARVQADHADAVALHVLARVYLARRMPTHAASLAAVAASVESEERADALVTGARALRALRQRDGAARVAEMAIAAGSTVGYEVLARLRTTDAARLKRERVAHVSAVLELRRKVCAADRVRYWGASRSPAAVVAAVKSAQSRKLNTTASDAVNLAERARRGHGEPTP